MFRFPLEKARRKVCRPQQLEIGSNDDMKLSKRHVRFKLLIFLLKWFTCTLCVAVDKTSSFIFCTQFGAQKAGNRISELPDCKLFLREHAPRTLDHVTAMLWYHMKHQLLPNKVQSRNKLPWQQEGLAKTPYSFALVAHI